MPEPSPHPPLTIAFICPSISGHANVHLANLHHLLTIDDEACPPLHLHLISEEALRNRLDDLPHSKRHHISFHALANVCYWKEAGEGSATDRRHGPPRLFAPGGLRAYNVLRRAVGMPLPRYLEYYESALAVLGSLKEELDLCVVDVLMAAGPIGDACTMMGMRYGVLSPIPSLDFCRMATMSLEHLWKFPAVWSGDKFPLPLWRIPENIALTVIYAYFLFLDPSVRAVRSLRSARGIRQTPLSDLPFHLVPSISELEYPHQPLQNTILAGPMLVPVPPLNRQSDIKLAAFLRRGRTAIFNMGSLFEFTATDVEASANAFVMARRRLNATNKIQILWKLPRASDFSLLLDQKLLGEDRKAILVEEWIGPPALAVLQHPNIVISIHHGGANSVHEAAYAGVPQIVLPQWLDLYDFATRVESLGHGLHANKRAPAGIDADELADALVYLLSSSHGDDIRARAHNLGERCRAAGGVNLVGEVLLDAAIRGRADRTA